MNIVRWNVPTPGIAVFEIDYGEKRASITIEKTGVTGAPEEASTPGDTFYRERLKELCDAIQAKDTYWTSRPGN